MPGRLDRLVPITFPEKEVAALHATFMSGLHGTRFGGGRMMITAEEAAAIGRRLAEVLFPREVFELFAASLATVLRGGSSGLRIPVRDGRVAARSALGVRLSSPIGTTRAGCRRSCSSIRASPMIRQTGDASVRTPAIAGQQRLSGKIPVRLGNCCDPPGTVTDSLACRRCKPPTGRRARDAEVRGDGYVAGALDEIDLGLSSDQ